VQVPERWVTLGAPGTALLPGTTEVMTEDQYRREVVAPR
jgi:hypothetical protein